MADQDDHKELAEALQAVLVERTKTAADDRAARARRRAGRGRPQWPFVVVLVFGLVALGWIWTARPSVIFGPGTNPPRSAEAREARLRFAIYLAHARVQQYVATHGRVPTSLTDAGGVADGLRFEATGGEWRVRADADGVPLALTGRMDADSFLDNALQVLRDDQ